MLNSLGFRDEPWRWNGMDVAAMCALLVVWMNAASVDAQQRYDVEVGGGFLFASIPDNVKLPSVPTVDARGVLWSSGRWGVGGHVFVGIGSEDVRDSHIAERSQLAYVQATVRYRYPLSSRNEVHAGVGWGMASWRETSADSLGTVRSEAYAFLPAVELMVSQSITDSVSVRGGVGGVPLIHVHPVVLVAYTF